MARLKVRQYLIPRIVQPENDNAFMGQQASGLPKGNDSGQGFTVGNKVNLWKTSPKVVATELT